MSDFKVKIASQKWCETSPKSFLALYNMKKWTENIIMTSARDNAQLMGKSTRLVCVQSKEGDFERKSLAKVIFNNYYAKISFRWMCIVQKISVWHYGILTFFYMRHFPSFLVLGLILVQTAVLATHNMSVNVCVFSFPFLLYYFRNQKPLYWYVAVVTFCIIS